MLLAAACGYVGPVMPPSAHIPEPVTDLSAAERGPDINCQFTLPKQTSDSAWIKRFDSIELRVGPAPEPFDMKRWAASTKPYEVPVPELPKSQDDRATTVTLARQSLPASDWAGQRVAVAVRTAAREGRFSPWSNVVTLDVVAPLSPPVVTAASDPQGAKLTWPAQQPGLKYRILRQGPKDARMVEIGVAETTGYVDSGAQYGTAYRYQVVALSTGKDSEAESAPSQVAELTPVDTFPPSTPANVTALAAPDSVEVSWERSPEADLKGYFIYRSVDGGPFTRVGDMLAVPAFSDKDVHAGHKYSYEVSAADERANESARSPAVEVAF